MNITSAIENIDIEFFRNNIDLCLTYKCKCRDENCLHDAKSIKIMELLLDSGIDINSKDGEGRTYLHYYEISVEMMKFLIDRGIDVNAKCIYNYSPLYTHLLCYDKVKILIENGADVNARGDGGYTLLHCCEEYEIVKLLIDSCERSRVFDYVNARNEYGFTPLHSVRSSEVTKLLIENGSVVNARNNSGLVPLYYGKPLETCKILIENGVDVDSAAITFLKELYGQFTHRLDYDLMMLLILTGCAERYNFDNEEYCEIIDKLVGLNFYSFNFIPSGPEESDIEEYIKDKLKENLVRINRVTNLSQTVSSVVFRCLTPNCMFII